MLKAHDKIMQGDVTENLTQEILGIKGVSSRDMNCTYLFIQQYLMKKI